MSVTFTAQPHDLTVTGYRVSCYCPDTHGVTLNVTAGDYDTALLHLLPYRVPGADLSALGCTSEGLCEARLDVLTEHMDAPSVNVNNGNADTLLRALGYRTDTTITDVQDAPELGATALGDAFAAVGAQYGCGQDTADAFLGRVLMALAVLPADAGREAHTTLSHGGGVLVECGRRAGYMQDTLGRLQAVAQYALDHDLSVTWG